MEKPLVVSLPESRKRAVFDCAGERGESASGLVNRVLTMYLRDPVLFERLFQEIRESDKGVHHGTGSSHRAGDRVAGEQGRGARR
jgi:hypothetical protein